MPCSPADSDGRKFLAEGIWNAATKLQVRGGQAMHFTITNANVVGTSVRVRADNGQELYAPLPLPALSVDFLFTRFGPEPDTWSFDVSTDADAFFVTWCLWSTWVPTVPTVTGVSPDLGVPGSAVTVRGSGIGGVTHVRFGGTPAKITYFTDTEVDVVVPAGSGSVDLTVTTPVGTSAVAPAGRFAYLPVPVVTAVIPDQGLAGDALTVVGNGFAGASDVSVGPQSVSPTAVSDTQLALVVPPGSGRVDVAVTTAAGTSAATAGSRFAYLEIPSVTGVTPSDGLPGDLVTVTGSGFVGLVDVSFGPVSVTPASVADDQMQLFVPNGLAGTVDVTATNRAGTSPVTRADEFTHLDVPVVSGMVPAQGSAGTLVTVFGSGFAGLLRVDFGPFAAVPIAVSGTQLQVSAPKAFLSGPVDVTVTNRAGTSAVSPADEFTYVAPPVVDGVFPARGVAGTPVVVHGSGFTPLTNLAFGWQSVAPIAIADTEIQVYAPDGTGTVDVTVTTAAGMSPITPANEFTYVSVPVVQGVYPAQGFAGTLITVYGTGFTPLLNLSFGWQSVNPIAITDAEIQVYAPGGFGIVNVVVTTAAGSSPATPTTEFTYV